MKTWSWISFFGLKFDLLTWTFTAWYIYRGRRWYPSIPLIGFVTRLGTEGGFYRPGIYHDSREGFITDRYVEIRITNFLEHLHLNIFNVNNSVRSIKSLFCLHVVGNQSWKHREIGELVIFSTSFFPTSYWTFQPKICQFYISNCKQNLYYINSWKIKTNVGKVQTLLSN